MKKTVRAVGGTFIGIEKTGEATLSTQKERGFATVSIRLLSIITWVASVSVWFRSKARGARVKYGEKMAHFFGSRSFLPAAKTPLSFFAPKPNEKGWLRRLYQSRNVKVEIYKFAVINVHFRISRLFFGSICRRVTVYDYTLKNFNINYGLCLS